MGTPMQRVDIPAKVTGGAAYVQDMRLPGMLHARVVRQPGPGAVLGEFDASPIEKMPGVVKVVREGSYLAVVAEREWQAIKAVRALAAAATWSGAAELPDERTILDTIRALPARDIPRSELDQPGRRAGQAASPRATRGPIRCTARSARLARVAQFADGG